MITEQLIAEAVRSQHDQAGDHGMPDFSSVLENPLRDAETSDYLLTTSPRLGLAKATAALS